jgi:hypothetical protein
MEIGDFRGFSREIRCFSLFLVIFKAIFSSFSNPLTRESVVTGLKLLSVEQTFMPSKIEVLPALFCPTIKLMFGPGTKDIKSIDLRFDAE